VPIIFGFPDDQGIGEMSRLLRSVQAYTGHRDLSLHSNLTLTFQLQGHITIGLRSPDNLGVGEVSSLLRPVEM